jgi:flagellar L-ring protein FlgH
MGRASASWSAALLGLVLCQNAAQAAKPKKPEKPAEPTALERYVADAVRQSQQAPAPSAGALWQPGAPLANLFRDPKAYRLNDLVTITVAENLSALSSGTTKTQRASTASAAVTALGHPFGGSSALANLANINGNQTLDGEGSTMRQTSLATAMSGRVAGVLPNGYLVIEGYKTVQVNSEQQVIVVRGVIRPIDIASDNSIQSNQLAQMEVSVNGKGVVGDAVRRPSLLYRLLLGILPF